MSLERIVRLDKKIRSIGFDDAPFARDGSEPVSIAGVVCASTQFEGMVWGEVVKDGFDATDTVIDLLRESKFLPQLHLALFDGVAFGGFNILDLERLHAELDIPCVSVMRRRPEFKAIEAALEHLDQTERRLDTMRRAGPVHAGEDIFFQVVGQDAELISITLQRLTLEGHIPEPIRMAHLIGSAVQTGESGRRA